MIAPPRAVHDTPLTAVRFYLSRSLLSLILMGSASCIPVLGQTTAGAPALSSSSVTLQWDRSPSRDVKGYRIHYGTAAGKYPFSIDVGKRTTCKISNLPVGKKYYFVVAAYNAKGNESLPSNERSLVVLPSNVQKRN